MPVILAIESSCDDTSAAICVDGQVLSNVIATQAIHQAYGGVVPELASREHLRAIVPVVQEAMQRAGVAYSDLEAVAVTEGPGLAGALLVGLTFAKALAFGSELPLIGVNHQQDPIADGPAQRADAAQILARVGKAHFHLERGVALIDELQALANQLLNGIVEPAGMAAVDRDVARTRAA